MAIYKVSGQMLQDTLIRDSLNLAVANTLSSTSALFIDVVNNRVGINSNVANVALDVAGNIAVGNISVTGNVDGNIVNTSTITSTGALFINTATSNIVTFSGNVGMAIPYGNTAQRPYPAATGTIRINTALNQIEAWDGVSWVTGSGGSGGTILDQQFNGDGTNTTFSLTYGNSTSTQNSIFVSINGTAQIPGIAYSVDTANNTVTFAEIPLTTDVVDIRYLAAATPPGAIYNSTGNSAVHTYDAGNITFVTNSTVVAAITTDGLLDVSTGSGVKLPTYTVAQAANIASPTTGQVIYVTDGDTGNPCLAVYSGGAFKRIALGANIST
jgi:hypothetical protein